MVGASASGVWEHDQQAGVRLAWQEWDESRWRRRRAETVFGLPGEVGTRVVEFAAAMCDRGELDQ